LKLEGSSIKSINKTEM